MKLPLLAFAIALLPACAATPPQEKHELREPRRDVCVFESRITGFNALDDHHVVLYGIGRGDSYLAEVTPGCFDLQNQSSLTTIDGDGNGQICGYGRDNIAFREFGRTESCRIVTLEKATEERIAAVMEKERKSKKPRKVIIQ